MLRALINIGAWTADVITFRFSVDECRKSSAYRPVPLVALVSFGARSRRGVERYTTMRTFVLIWTIILRIRSIRKRVNSVLPTRHLVRHCTSTRVLVARPALAVAGQLKFGSVYRHRYAFRVFPLYYTFCSMLPFPLESPSESWYNHDIKFITLVGIPW